MAVVDAVAALLEKSGHIGEVDRELALALARQIDTDGSASAVKELRAILGDLEQQKPAVDGLDELARKRAARTAG